MNNLMLSGSLPKRNVINTIIVSLLLIFFVHTLTDSYMRLQSLKNVLAFYTKNTASVAWMIMIVELTTALLLYIKKSKKIGFILTMLISFFAGYVLFSNPHYPHAFGGILNNLTPNQQLIVYSLLFLLSTIGLLLNLKKASKESTAEPHTIVFT